MFVLAGYLVVIGCVLGGYALAGGNFGVLLHAAPHELFVIGGAATGAFLVGNSTKTIKATLRYLPTLLRGSKYTKARYLALMSLLYAVLVKARKDGMMAIEADVEKPQDSALFKKYPLIAADHHLMEFITDYLRMMVSGNLNAHEIENLMDNEIDTHHHEAAGPVHAIQAVGDALPAFGIVAAVLGVVKTMASVGASPAVLGQMIAGALVGTFLGILLAYGFVTPLAQLANQKVDESTKELQCVKATLLASVQGYAPVVALEFGRKVLYSTERPGFSELEGHVKGRKAA
ncbi:flagellar motor stator protein MotA [Ramlibacter alkalitolerans]|uniref:Flagellar motor stator protein MotA n=1 Tax=Ramlibacter alkalitolerans TaxID=2039631 RepID=A0ABS1JKW2_9BURK|nr:flagellar motor stator protein MotA [Ramlibacter alkalitolerans]MBL0424874.1 flagellar motor stator protein MotA [Ramlibacter alkalitolerans]